MGNIKLTTVPFNGTPEKEKQLRAALKELKHLEGAVMPALQTAQQIYGYLPEEVQKIVAEEMNIPLEKIFGISTFYSFFTLNPQGKHNISVCLGTACYVKGAGAVIEKFSEVLGIEQGGCTPDRQFSLVATRCLGCCGLAPTATVNGDVYGKLTPDDVAGIVAKYKGI